MANVPISNMTVTWTDSGTTYNAIKMNVTDTASNAASLLMDLQVGGVSKFKVPKNGNPVFVVPTSGFLEVNGNGDGLRAVNGSSVSAYSVYGVRMGASNTLTWGSSADGPATADTILTRDNAADTLALRRTTNAQTFRVYTSYTDASNNQFCQITGNGLTVQQAGLGAAADLYINNAITGRSIFLQTANTPRWQIGATGNFIAATDNSYDIGASGATRPRIGYFGTRVDAPTLRTDTAYTVATLPAAGTAGRRAYVTDATTPTFLGALTGGGAVVCPVFDNGTAWVAG